MLFLPLEVLVDQLLALKVALKLCYAIHELRVGLLGNLLLALGLVEFLNRLQVLVFHFSYLFLRLFDGAQLRQLLLNVVEHLPRLVLLLRFRGDCSYLLVLLKQGLCHFVLGPHARDHLLLCGDLSLGFSELALKLVLFAVSFNELRLKLIDLAAKLINFGFIPFQVGHELRVDPLQILDLLLQLHDGRLSLSLSRRAIGHIAVVRGGHPALEWQLQLAVGALRV